ncbi:ABC transporter substrate binding protein [Roseateles sp. LYH14W]|uniref:ABC transporter substrate binding protein n=1 Tax=Pelomonas parva TaxID=3299032 RepID=A0ABW7F1Z4_9BURK
MLDTFHAYSPPKLVATDGGGLMGAQEEYPARSRSHNSHLARALVLVLSVVGAALLTSDSSPPSRPALIVFLGIDSPKTDLSFQRFMAAVERLPAASRRRLRVEFTDSGLSNAGTGLSAAKRMVSLRPEVVVAPSSATAKLAKEHLRNTPIVFGSFLHPVRYGIISSMETRGEAITGIWVADTLDVKRLEILHDAYPVAKRIAVLIDRPWGDYFDTEKTLSPVAARLGLEVSVLFAENTADAEALFAEPQSRLFDAWCLPRTGLAGLNTNLIVGRLREWGKPVILANTADMASGAPLSYALDMSFAWPAIAELVLRILDGERAGDIPVLRPQRTVLVVRPAPAGGFPPPSAHVIRRADVVLR